MYTILIYSGSTHTGFTINGIEAAWDAWQHTCELIGISTDDAYAELWDNEANEMIDYAPEMEIDDDWDEAAWHDTCDLEQVNDPDWGDDLWESEYWEW